MNFSLEILNIIQIYIEILIRFLEKQVYLGIFDI